MKSLIIGGAGFVGGYLAQHLLALGHEVAVTKMPSEQAPADGVSVYDLDIRNQDAVLQVLKNVRPDLVFHLAAQSSVAVSWKQPQLTADINIKGILNVLDGLRRYGGNPRVLLVGSGEEYGYVLPEETPVRETNPVRPGNIYAATKACQNMVGRIYAQAYDLDLVMVRPFNHIGPNQSPVFVAADFCKQAAEIEAGMREAVMRVGNLDVRRDFTDVRDVVRAYALLVKKGHAGETYNIGSGHAVKIGDILQTILDQSTASIRVEVDSEKLRPADVPVMEADISKVQSLTGWKPQIRLEQTIGDMLDYWRQRMDDLSKEKNFNTK